MTIDEFETHLVSTGHNIKSVDAGGESYVIIIAVVISAGSHAGKTCDVGILRGCLKPPCTYDLISCRWAKPRPRRALLGPIGSTSVAASTKLRRQKRSSRTS